MKIKLIYFTLISIVLLINPKVLCNDLDSLIEKHQLLPKRKLKSILNNGVSNNKIESLYGDSLNSKSFPIESDKNMSDSDFQAEDEKFKDGFQNILNKTYGDVLESLIKADKFKSDSVKVLDLKEEISQIQLQIRSDSIKLKSLIINQFLNNSDSLAGTNSNLSKISNKIIALNSLKEDFQIKKAEDSKNHKGEVDSLSVKISQVEVGLISDIVKSKQPIKSMGYSSKDFVYKDSLAVLSSVAVKLSKNKSKLPLKQAELKTLFKSISLNKPTSIEKAVKKMELQLGDFLRSKENLPLLLSIEIGLSKYRVLLIDPSKNDIHIHNNGTGSLTPLGDSWMIFEREKKIKPYAVLNAGMYEPNGAAKGLLIEDRLLKHNVDESTKGYGNFYMQPNGVFFQENNGKYGILETREFVTKFATSKKKKTLDFVTINFATQSGPMMIKDNVINSHFYFNSNNTNIRNGVGVSNRWKRPIVVIVISDTKVNFYDFALLFKSVLGCENALYLDGAISKMYIRGEKNKDLSGELGPKILVTEKKTLTNN